MTDSRVLDHPEHSRGEFRAGEEEEEEEDDDGMGKILSFREKIKAL